jgi:hypothetical protein
MNQPPITLIDDDTSKDTEEQKSMQFADPENKND